MADVRSPSRPANHRFDPLSLAVLAGFAVAWIVVVATRSVPAWVYLLYAGTSVLSFLFYGIDKAAARAGRDRIPESMLLSLGFVGGWPGAVLAQQWFRHKTAKTSFRIRFWLSVIANWALFLWSLTIMPRSLS